jgi:predicted DNA-binding transcriptional regulator AlpA
MNHLNHDQAVSFAGQLYGISRRTFDRLVREGRLPGPIYFNKRVLRWNRSELEEALTGIAQGGQGV